MYTLLVAAVVWLTYNCWSWRRGRAGPGAQFYDPFTAGLISFFVIAVIGTAAQLIPLHYLPYKQVDTTLQLAAMRSSDSPTGTFVWGSGHVADNVYYQVMVKNDDGSVSPRQIDSHDDVRIVEDASLRHEGRWTRHCRMRDFSAPAGDWTFLGRFVSVCGNTLTVPIGTVVNTFSAN